MDRPREDSTAPGGEETRVPEQSSPFSFSFSCFRPAPLGVSKLSRRRRKVVAYPPAGFSRAPTGTARLCWSRLRERPDPRRSATLRRSVGFTRPSCVPGAPLDPRVTFGTHVSLGS